MTKYVLGIDVSKDTLDVLLLCEERQKFHQFTNNPTGFTELVTWLENNCASHAHICLEATGKYSLPVAKHLYEACLRVSMVNPARIKYYRDSRMARNKTDRLDAFIIADFCRTQKPHLWSPSRPEVEELQEQTRYLTSLKKMRQQEKNRKSSGFESAFVHAQIQKLLEFIEQQITIIEAHIQEHICQHEDLRQQQQLLVTIPGVGKLTAAKLLAEIQDVERFHNAAQLAAYAGVTPQNYSSGTSVYKKPRMSKTGNVHLRNAIYMPTLVAKRFNPTIKVFCARLGENEKNNRVIIGAGMRKLLHVIYGVLKNKVPFDPNHGITS